MQVRNSWGTSWGESGFIRLSYGGNTCGIASDANFATVASAASSEEEEAKDARLRAEAEAAQAAGAPIVGADPSTYSPSN